MVLNIQLFFTFKYATSYPSIKEGKQKIIIQVDGVW